MAIRGGSGLGDALYVQAIARYLVHDGHEVEACSDWPDVFRPLAGRVTVSPFRRSRIDRLAHYATRRGVIGTTQFEDCCITAGVPRDTDLRLDWPPPGEGIATRLRDAAAGKPIVLVQMPRPPMDRKDGFGAELLPDSRVVQRAIDRLRGSVMLVQVGAGKPLHEFSGLDLDLANRTTVAELIDVASISAGFLGHVSFFVPLSESLLKPALFVWSRRGLNAPNEIIRQITPKKILHRPSGRHVIDDCSDQALAEAVDAFFEQVRGPALV